MLPGYPPHVTYNQEDVTGFISLLCYMKNHAHHDDAYSSAHGYHGCQEIGIPCVPVASPGLKLRERVSDERTLRRSQTGQAWLELQSQ